MRTTTPATASAQDELPNRLRVGDSIGAERTLARSGWLSSTAPDRLWWVFWRGRDPQCNRGGERHVRHLNGYAGVPGCVQRQYRQHGFRRHASGLVLDRTSSPNMIAVHDVGANAAPQGPRTNPFRSNGQWRFPCITGWGSAAGFIGRR